MTRANSTAFHYLIKVGFYMEMHLSFIGEERALNLTLQASKITKEEYLRRYSTWAPSSMPKTLKTCIFQKLKSGADWLSASSRWLGLVFILEGEFGERSEEGESWNQKRHQKVQKEKPQLPLSGSLSLSDTQELTGDPLRGKMAAEGKKPTHALTAERHTYGLGPKFSVILE
ncbi:hypothetical protein LR48_Vigan07g143500 [Vigna angularis]|uniref:Uncharacterized protein n=1 Tax=Phaseolus angularis TaxID=3914 RepID=A0A0L9UYF5_PHAAN|nr:hypothetical protein LR48_Vigan07g143500 [Vigna angularis]